MTQPTLTNLVKPLTITTLFLSSFLLFLVQPILSKYLLPWFGGSSAVWIISLLFFQGLLLIGYLYSYLLIKLAYRIQLKIHFVVALIIGGLLAGLFFIWPSSIISSVDLSVDVSRPVVEILVFLFTHIGLPYFLLSTTSTLTQYWIGHAKLVSVPYKFYSVSNFASFVAVVCYPVLVEPFWGVLDQTRLWSIFYLLFVLCLLWTVLVLFRFQFKNQKKTVVIKATYKQISLWLFLPAVSTLLLMATTSKITQAVAPVPFLWLLPLCLFLISYVVAFSERLFFKDYFFPAAFTILSIMALLLTNPVIVIGLGYKLLVYSLTLFCGFVSIHLYLYKKRPHLQLLRLYYLVIAAGGFLGGIFTAIIAPLLFNDYHEFYIAFLGTLIISGLYLSLETNILPKLYSKRERTVIFLIIVVVIFGASYYQTVSIFKDPILHKTRNFYTSVQVAEREQDGKVLRYMKHGTIIHGGQILEGEDRYRALLYYAPTSGAGTVFALSQELATQPRNIGVMGLGVGTLAAFGQPDETIDFFELDPQILGIAQNYFTYLDDSKADVNVFIGDARILLENSDPNKLYDILVMDAFSDDSIPMHLLTAEAFELYLSKLTSGGTLLVNISNNYIDLAPLLLSVAEYYKVDLRVILNTSENPLDGASEWAVLTTNQSMLASLDERLGSEWRDLSKETPVKMWTDDYSNLFSVLKK